MAEDKVRVRVRSVATDKKKALEQYQEMRRAGTVKSAVIIVERSNGDIDVLGQLLTPSQVAQRLLMASDAVAQLEGARLLTKLEPHEEPVARGEVNTHTIRVKEVTQTADGTLVPPVGESFISCGVCGHPRWYVLFHAIENRMARYVCSHCSNEIKQVRLTHEAGHA